MDRFSIALGKQNVAFKFPPTQSVARTVKYIDYCIKNKAPFVAHNIPEFILFPALVKVSFYNQVPIMVKSEEKARVLITAYSHKHIYAAKTIPYFPQVICYDCSPTTIPHRYSKPYLVVYPG
jgi:hypothetical protein